MTPAQDRELRDWIDDWHAAGPAAPSVEAIAIRVRKRTRTMKLWLTSEAVVATVALAFLSYRAIIDPDPFEKLAMALLGLIAVSGLAVSWWLWRGMWRASAETTSAFLALQIARAGRLRRYLLIGWAILAAEVAVFVPWIGHRLYGRGTLADPSVEWFAWSFLTTWVLIAVVGLLAAMRWARHEREQLLAIERQMDVD